MTPRDLAVPRYDHIFVVFEENKSYPDVMDPRKAPVLSRLAKTYGNATAFYAEVHPSEGNYVAFVGGNTFGIHDDDAFYCAPHMRDAHCEKSALPGYVNHTVRSPHLGDQLERHGLTWKAYYETIPAPGSRAVTAGDPKIGSYARDWELYASKHSGFMNFASAQRVARQHIVGFDQFHADLASGSVPSFALVVPNQCNDMHGLDPTDYSGEAAARVPADCNHNNTGGLIRRGDAALGSIVEAIERSPVWRSRANVAIVVTFDEGSKDAPEGCCGIDPKSVANFGGGHIPTVVVTNHGPRGLTDNTPYSHYSLLRTIEDAFGIHQYLQHAADSGGGVQAMSPLFSITH